MDFPKKLKYIIEENKISREELAEAVGLSYWAISKYLNGERSPDLVKAEKIADYLSEKTGRFVSVDYLMGRVNERGVSLMEIEQRLIDNINLDDETLMESISFSYGGKAVSKEQIKISLALIRESRSSD